MSTSEPEFKVGDVVVIDESAPTEDPVAEVERLDAEAPPGPWQMCTAHKPICQCGLIWSLPLDTPVLYVKREGDDPDGVTFTPEQRAAIGALAARYRTLAPTLAAEVKSLRAALDETRASMDSAISASQEAQRQHRDTKLVLGAAMQLEAEQVKVLLARNAELESAARLILKTSGGTSYTAETYIEALYALRKVLEGGAT